MNDDPGNSSKLKELNRLDDSERSEIVVNASEVEAFSKKGYRTVEICNQDVMSAGSASEHIPSPHGHGGYPQQVYNTVPFALSQLKFFMVKDGKSCIAELSKELDECMASAKELVTKIVKHEGTIAGFKTNSEVLTRDIERRRLELEKEWKEKDELRKRLHLMEADVAKFRKEIGERRWREITEPEPKS